MPARYLGSLVSLKVGDKEIATRVGHTRHLTDLSDGGRSRLQMELHATFETRTELWKTVLDMLEEQERRRMLMSEICAAECELFASMLRYWTFF